MKKITNIKGIDTLIFAETIEHEAYEQIKKMVNFEAYSESKVRIMPDTHAGKGCTVGTTMVIKDKVTPNLVGVDVGCGMLTVELKDKSIDFKKLDEVIKKYVPHGFEVHSKSNNLFKVKFDFSNLRAAKSVDLDRALKSIGTLGGGNHFIEVAQSEKSGAYYLIIHSGSRKLGGEICKYYQDRAFKKVNEMKEVKEALIKKLRAEGRAKEIDTELKKIKKPIADKDLAYLEGEDFDDYMNDMSITQKFASANREMMAKIIISKMGLNEASRFETIHNYIDFKRNILRKGAVSSESGETLLIPINMRDGSLLCKGKGNEEWNFSAPHGAGRLMSRSKAKSSLDMDEFKKTMKGIYTTSVVQETLDEAPGAYKPMEEIMATITDTAEIIDILKPVYNFKSH